MAGHEDHARQEGRVVALEGAIEGWAIQDGHPQITHYDVIGVLFQEVQRVDPVRRRVHLVTTQRERVSGYRADMRVIIDNQDMRHVRVRSDYSIT
jgi:hypothetical protein